MEHAGSIYADMMDKLRRHGVEHRSWYGIPGAKSYLDLFTEIMEGESHLVEENESLKRVLSVAYVDVLVQAGDRLIHLIEQRQTFPDGQIRTRKLSTSLGEKLEPDESPLDGAVRGIKEELGLTVASERINLIESGTALADSQSYPGLATERHYWHFQVELDESIYKDYPDGFVEENDRGIRSEFVWEDVT